jgi:hypothetical protein
MGLGQFNYEVNTDRVPWCHQCLRGMELTKGRRCCNFVLLHRSQVLM